MSLTETADTHTSVLLLSAQSIFPRRRVPWPDAPVSPLRWCRGRF